MNSIRKKNDEKFWRSLLADPLIIYSLYIVSFFIYRDFGVRMIVGYGILSIYVFFCSLNFYKSKKKFKVTKIHIAYLFYSLMILLNFIRPSSNHNNENIVYMILTILVVTTLLISDFKGKDISFSLKLFSVTSVILAVLILFFQIFQDLFFVTVYPYLSEIATLYADKYFFRGYSVTFGGATFTYYILVLGLLSLLSKYFFFRPTKKQKNIIIFCITMLVITLIIIGRRGELIALIGTLSLLYISTANKEKIFKRIIHVILFLIAIILFSVLLLPLLSKIDALRRYTMTVDVIVNDGQVTGGVTSGRVGLYKLAWSLFLKNPIVGIGWGNYTKYAVSELGYAATTTMDTHNVVLQLLAETGIVGFIMIVLPVIYIYFQTIKQTHRLWTTGVIKEKDVWMMSANLISFSLQSFMLAVSLVDPINYKFIFVVLYFICIYLFMFALEKEKYRNYEYINNIRN